MTTPIADRLADKYREQWTEAIEGMIGYVSVINTTNGWFDSSRTFEADIALLHSEVSEAFEAFRKNNWTKEKDSVQDELADVLIRLLDTCDRYQVNLTEQFLAKLRINETRGYKHNGKSV